MGIGSGIFEFQFVGFNLGEVEDVIDKGEQSGTAGLDGIEILLLLAVLNQSAQYFRETQNSVHRRANFMGHVGQKHAFGMVGGVGLTCLALCLFFRSL